MDEKIRARLDEIYEEGLHLNLPFDALRAVLDLASAYRERGKVHEAYFIERAIADALGVEILDPIIVAINADKMNPYRHG